MGKASRRKHEPKPTPADATFRVREVSINEMVSWKLSTPQPKPGSAGASEIQRRVQAERQTLVLVNRGPAGLPVGIVWVCPGCGNTWTTDVRSGQVQWAREDRHLTLSVAEPLVCIEAAEGRCASKPWTLRAGTLAS